VSLPVPPPIIDCMNSPGSERCFQPLRTIAFYSSATSNRAGEVVGSVQFVPWATLSSIGTNFEGEAEVCHGLCTTTMDPPRMVDVQSHEQGKNVTDVSSRQRRSNSKEFQGLVQQLSVRDRPMVLLIGSTGLRRSEMISLTWSDLNINGPCVSVLNEQRFS
jgi:hypothetical protein